MRKKRIYKNYKTSKKGGQHYRVGRKNYKAVIGFRPDEKQKIEEILEENPKLKDKIERVFTDIEKSEGLGYDSGRLAFIVTGKKEKIPQEALNAIKELEGKYHEYALHEVANLYRIKDKTDRLLITEEGAKQSKEDIKSTMDHELLHKIIEKKAPKFHIREGKKRVPLQDLSTEELFVMMQTKGKDQQKGKDLYKKHKKEALLYHHMPEKFEQFPGMVKDVVRRKKQMVLDIEDLKKQMQKSPVKIRKLPKVWKEPILLGFEE
jgi:hypothetical protein